MPLYSLINQIIHLAEARGEKDIVALVLELEREITKILAKLVDLRYTIDEVLGECSVNEKFEFTKIELDILDNLRESSSRCLDVSDIIKKLENYSTATVVIALKRLKSMRVIDLDLDIDRDGKMSIRACLRLR